MAFCNRLLAQGIIAVPGRGFGMSGYIRLCCAVDLAIIERSAEAWKRAMQD